MQTLVRLHGFALGALVHFTVVGRVLLHAALPAAVLLGTVSSTLGLSGCNHRDLTPSIAPSAERSEPARPDKDLAGASSTAPLLLAPPDPTALPPDYRTADERNSIDIFRFAAPSTVFVTQSRLVVDYFAGTTSEVPAGSGSGFIWDAQGHIVTNFHVIRGAQALSVTLQDHRTFEATVVGVEPRKDIAVLRLKEAVAGLVPIRVHDKPAKLEVGQKTIAIGNPFGLDQTLTTGIISALGRQVDGIGGVTIRDMVQTDAAINPGNSGGPLLDSSGRLIGMNTMIFSRSGASAGIGFAVPMSSIRRVVPQIIEFGKPKQVGLGIQIDPAQRLEQRARISGVVVLEVITGGPAEKAGLVGIRREARGIKLGDVIVGINDEAVEDYDDLYNTLDRFNPGDSVKIWVQRDGKRVSADLGLVEIP
jgi:S1-C subfamily serine protease